MNQPNICYQQDGPAASGLAALASVAAHHGLPVNVASFRQLTGIEAASVEPVILMYAAAKCGLDATPLEGEFEQLPEVPLPAIVTFTGDRYQVLLSVDEASAVVGDTSSGLIQKMSRDDFKAAWTGDIFMLLPNDELPASREQLRRLTGLRFRVARMAGIEPFSLPRIAFVAAVLGWLASIPFARLIALLAGVCVLASLWMAAYPRGCRKCSATSSLSGVLPLPWMGVGFYALLTAAAWAGDGELARLGFLAAGGAHAALVGILFRKKIACYPCLATASVALTGVALTWSTGRDFLLVPVMAVVTWSSLEFAVKTAQEKQRKTLEELEARVLTEPVEKGRAKLVTYTRKECPICLYFKTAIRPALQETFGDALLFDDRDAADLPMGVPLFFISGAVRTKLNEIATEEMFPRLSAEIEAALAAGV